MLGTGRLRSGVKVLYKDSGLRNRWSDTASSTPKVDILKEVGNAYFVKVHSIHFSPKEVWVSKQDVIDRVMVNKPAVSKPVVKPVGRKIELVTGDTMVLKDVNGVELGVWTFKSK